MSQASSTPKRRRLSQRSSSRAKILQKEAYEDLKADLRRMINQDGCSDVTFICKDGGRVKASRSLLVARCNVLKGMLTNGMRETSLKEISLPDISSQALLCVFEFLHTGTILIPQPKLSRLEFEVVKAAQYFLLHNLVGIVLHIILERISEVATDLLEVAAVLTMTVEFSRSYQENECHGIKRKLVRLLSSDWKHSIYASNLSEEALHYLLSNTPAKSNYTQIQEYYRFRQVILWWAYQNASGWSKQTEETVESAVPLIRHESSLCFGADMGEEIAGSDPSLRLNSLLKASRDSAVRLLSTIDLRYMHLVFLEKVVMPLNCFSSSEITQARRFHALDKIWILKSFDFEFATCGWKHGKSLTVFQGGSFIKKIGREAGTAIALMQMSRTTRIQLWKVAICVEEVSHIEVGFMYINADQVSRWGESDLNKETFFHSSHTRVLKILFTDKRSLAKLLMNHQGEKFPQGKSLDIKVSRHTEVIFQYDFVRHNCSLAVNGSNFGICWDNLPDVDCYPVAFIGEAEGPCSGHITMRTPKMDIRHM